MDWFIALLLLAIALSGFLLLTLTQLILLRRHAENTRRRVDALYLEAVQLVAALSIRLGDDAAMQKAVAAYLAARTKAEMDAAAEALRSAPLDCAPPDWLAGWILHLERINFTKTFEAERRAAYNALAGKMPWRTVVALFHLQTQI